MRNKWLRGIKRFIELFTTGGTAYTKYGTEYYISSTGAVTTPPESVKKIMDRGLAHREAVLTRWRAELEQRDIN